MLSKTLLKLIDSAILPAITLVAVKIFGTIVINKFFNIPWGFTGFGVSYPEADFYVKSNSYSSFAMVLVVSLSLLWVLIRAHIFHESHITPRMSQRIQKSNLNFLIKNSFDLYSKAAVWLSYSYLLTIILSIQAFFNLVYLWVAVVSFLVSLNTTWFFIADVEEEIKASRSA